MNLPSGLQILILASRVAMLASPLNLVLGQTSAAGNAEVTPVIQICDLFRQLDAFDGKRVAVRGVLRFSIELGGLYSGGCEKPLILDGVERAQALETEFVGRSTEQRAASAHLNDIVNQIKKGGGRQANHVTLVGTLITRNPKLHQLGKRKGERMFGHFGVYPAHLEVSDIQNITIEQDAREPSNMELPK